MHAVAIAPSTHDTLHHELQVDTTAARREQAFRELYDRYRNDVRNYVGWFRGSFRDVDDVVQEVFLKVHERLDDLDPTRPVRPWLLRISGNVALNLIEEQKAQKRTVKVGQTTNLSCVTADDDLVLDTPDHRETPPEERTVQEETIARLRGLLADLPEEDGQVVEALYFKGLSQREAAEALGIPRRTIRDRHHRLLEMLRMQLEPEADSAA